MGGSRIKYLVKNNVKMNRNSALDGSSRCTQNLELQNIRLNKLNRIKTEKKSRKIIQRKNHKVAYANHVESGLTGVAAEDVSKGIKDKKDARDELQQNQSATAVVLKLMPRQQEYTNLCILYTMICPS